MKTRDIFTKILAVAGTLCLWFTILSPVFFSIIQAFRRGQFFLDYLMPAELFPAAFAGGVMLLWAAWWRGKYRWLIGAGLAAAVLLLVAGQGIAMKTGLATGVIEPAGWQWILVVACFIAYDLALIVVGVGGILLLRALFPKKAIPEG